MNGPPEPPTTRGTAGRLARYASINGLHGIVTHVCAAVAAGLLYRALGDDFGVFALITGSAIGLNFFDDSLGAFVVTSISRRRRSSSGSDVDNPAEEEHLRANLAASQQAYLIGSCAFALLLAAGLGGLYMARPDVGALMVLGAFTLCAFSLASFFGKFLEGNEEFLRLRCGQSSIALVRLAGFVLLITTTRDATLHTFLGWFAATYLLQAGLLAALASRSGSARLARISLRTSSRSRRELYVFCRPLLLAKFAAVASYRLDLWIVQGIAGAGATAAYAVAEAIGRFATQTLEVVKGVVLPVSVRTWKDSGSAWNRAFLVRASKASVLFTGGACVCLYGGLDSIASLWFGNVSDETRWAARLLLLFTVLTAFRSVAQSILVGQRLFHHLERHFLIAAAINVATSVTAVWFVGAWGAALGTAVAGIYLLLANLIVVERTLTLPSGTLAASIVVPGLLTASAAVVTAQLVPLPGAPMAAALLQAGLAGSVFALLFWWALLDADERRWLTKGAGSIGGSR